MTTSPVTVTGETGSLSNQTVPGEPPPPMTFLLGVHQVDVHFNDGRNSNFHKLP